MRHKLIRSITFIAFIFSGEAFSTTCTQGDWIDLICDATDWSNYQPGSRCWDDTATQAQMQSGCNNETIGCAELGGCFGPNPPGHWVVTVVNNEKVRCKCGCFAAETKFGSNGDFSGSDLIDRVNKYGADTTFALESYNLFDLTALEGRINGIIYGPEKEKMYVLQTARGSVSLTSAHPVVLADKNGEVTGVVRAQDLELGDEDVYLLDSHGVTEQLLGIERSLYKGNVVNFNVMADEASDHFVVADGFVMGDNAWQQALAREDARLLDRADILRNLLKEEAK